MLKKILFIMGFSSILLTQGFTVIGSKIQNENVFNMKTKCDFGVCPSRDCYSDGGRYCPSSCHC